MKKLVIGAALASGIFSAAVSAHQAGDWIVRAGTATVRPSESSDNVLGLGGFNINNNTQLGLTLTYLATDNIGVELLAATPFRHKVGLNSTGDIASVRDLPPTLMAQWYFGQPKDKLRPYVGVGVNYTTFFDEKFNQTGHDAGLSDLSLKDSWGVAGQVGVDYNLNDNWLINMSVWYIDMDTKVRFNSTAAGRQSIDTHINPWVFMFSTGYRF
ncbi:outer membrane protein OmpW [Martelella alba]|uniref:Outer membrane protein OmpW n=1 Tax=Martelella alba TaxID=2590451 RepID=A0ABY2SPW6_9HYPH|nr:outer membrane protein OmpW [Martelella alba]TKI08137.1 outer membrane protein OmpW [Martelella alba]